MIAIEQNIDQFFLETEESTKIIIEGSDEHLDLILSITKPLDILSQKFEIFNGALYNSINNYSDEEIQSVILPKLRQLNKSCLTLIGAIRTSILYRDIRTALKNYSRHYEVLREIIHDTHNFRISKDDEFDNLLKDLNAI
jgi:hypothetical protein